MQSSALANSLVEELTLEKDRLSNELYTLRTAKEMTSGGSSLAEIVVELRRKISTLELLNKVNYLKNSCNEQILNNQIKHYLGWK